MNKRFFIASLLLPLAACVASGDPPADHATRSPAAYPVIASIGTPFYLGFKAAVCGATLPMAGLAAMIAQVNSADSRWNQEDLKGHAGDAVIANCGPPYYVTP